MGLWGFHEKAFRVKGCRGGPRYRLLMRRVGVMSRLARLPFALVVSRLGSVHDEVHPEGTLPAMRRFPDVGQAPISQSSGLGDGLMTRSPRDDFHRTSDRWRVTLPLSLFAA